MKIFNTLTRQKEELVPIHPGEIRMYVCGPTVYNYIHIGNARPACVFDTLRRYLEYIGYKVTYVQNFTDIDDKIIRRANEEGTDFLTIAEKYIKEYKVDAAGLNVREATVHPRATENIDTILEIVKTLVEKGYAYESNGDVYFRTHRFDGYGKLSHQPLEDLEAGARIDVSEQKESPVDFALWKAAKPGEPFWPSPWGNGRPGWHIECSAMAKRYLGETIDLHCGGLDLIFPHHENEIAQSECAWGVPFARYWMHNEYININNKKMSKSLGNFRTAREVGEHFGYEPIRFIMLSAHYRSPMNYSEEVMDQAKASLERLYTCRENIDFALQSAVGEARPEEAELMASMEKRRDQFKAAMDNDLNTADALAAIFELVREINTLTTGTTIGSKAAIELGRTLLDELCGVLGLLYNRKGKSLDSEVETLIEERQQARKNRDFKRADEIRDTLKNMGIVLEDTPQGIKWHMA
ncbi:cysteine--tRNA ligase [Acetanaerobacterium elongatum]|uniref:Cysteine--tRNA ligase n=1 Tax=Acetanaerobacterium elongatum TaxID=258515 RepID=A0A1G9UZX4_9FIRM|nr:cysteine--tRNA ligase [Acetanaerobacterium elongatum]SDM65409.1 cysteinyl-tRNA synthetase [Acetanaerobacterium elongatum]